MLATVQALEACKKELGVRTILGVSNISFGLPCRPYLNTTFLTMAMYAGLDLAIMNPSSEEMMAAVYAYNVLINRDAQSMQYIERYANRVPASTALQQAAQAAPAAASSDGSAEISGPYAALIKAVEKAGGLCFRRRSRPPRRRRGGSCRRTRAPARRSPGKGRRRLPGWCG